MKTIAYLFSLVLALPSVLLAAFFLLVGHAVAQKTLGAMIVEMLKLLYSFATWGAWLGMAAVAALLAAGFFTRARPWGALAVFVIVLGSVLTILLGDGRPKTLGEMVFLAPAIFSMLISGRLFVLDWRSGTG